MKSNCIICSREFNSRKNQRDGRKTRCCSMECRDRYLKLYTPEGKEKVLKNGQLLCYSCKNYKSPDEFYNREDYGFTNTRDKKSTTCKTCQNRRNSEIREKNKHNLKYTLSRRLTSAKASSNRRRIEYDKTLTSEYLIDLYNTQNGLCSISKQKMTVGEGKRNYHTISLDRIDSSKGYIKGNLHLVCWIINQMKNDMSMQELTNWCSLISINN